MERIFVINRIQNVVTSCNTTEQLIVALRYCEMLIIKYCDSLKKDNDDILECLLIRQQRREITNWMVSLIKTKQSIIELKQARK
jgi:hypothetical protein